ncbi:MULTISPECIES: hypothetical protein [unclassified Bradyrhizobium]|uniref:hypothetical protein n=1 Tax=unclassified Bradyrhizobium TaxID=2631580 RepID=UPI001CD7B39E|nr:MULTISPECIES: hypothetical protein [unclassified Bradyrhizobium]MCA1386380.1 hypothetical protein [Bradyrhizobium sp. BRP05]MCA1394483.1 hypothetical protein [Bradyrhizobium sp. IC3123]MCA1423976.1 hypothetical protein [Bradyrhizobium sp. BRP23]MCA1431106.1 hypothetical protein [Bradyrhizobium sp. NBAIM16]MCA1480554.1 hypothetical protein [Bradyrhizobium sp. NBAIM08]
MAFPSFIQSPFILEEAVNPESAKDSVRYRDPHPNPGSKLDLDQSAAACRRDWTRRRR